MSETHSQTFTVGEPALGHMDALPAGTMLGEFELQGLLGVGGFGMVYKAYDHSLHRAVAIKEYMPSALVGRVAGLQVSVRSTADDQPFLAGLTSFISEARLLARFDHPSLVKVYRFWEANNTAYMVMPLYQGMTLKAARSLMSGPPPEAWLRTILWSVTQALKVLHDNGTIHRDVSPDNIFLQDVGPPVLLDLGAARRAVLERGHKHTAILKVNYAPIEQYADATDLQEGAWTDLYALGAVIHGCVCNEAPLPATSRVVRDRMPSFFRVAQTAQTHFGTHYSPAFVDAIAHTLSIEPAERTQSVLDFCEEMKLQVSLEWSRFDWRLALGDSVSLAQPSTATQRVFDEVLVSEQTQTQIYQPDAKTLTLTLPQTTQSPASGTRTETATVEGANTSKKSSPALWGVLLFLLAVAIAVAFAVWRRPAASLVMNPPVLENKVLPGKEVMQNSAPPSAPVKPALPEKIKPPVAATPSSRVGVPPDTKKNAASSEAVVTQQELQRKSNELCADVGVLARSMCIYRNCQLTENAKMPVCIEDRKKWESQNNPR